MYFKTLIICVLVTEFFTTKADCYTEYDWCSSLAAYFFVSDTYSGSENAEKNYMSSMRVCFKELESCASQ